ncbi:hypothetical protein F4677DRAFT_248453 [Hypoxylon crocopeplum]|nr:hypothetical protein F4677DRAFT_248453 [Hypoxylon crocopeplum]
MAQNDNTASQGSPGMARRTARLKASEQPLPTPRSINTVKSNSTAPLPKSSRFRQRGPYNFDGAMSLEHDNTEDRSKGASEDVFDVPTVGGSKFSHTNLVHSLFPSASKINVHSESSAERPMTNKSGAPEEACSTPRAASKSEFVTRCTGKVSDLRRFFERSSPRGSSPSPFKTFWQNRNRSKPAIKAESILSARYQQAGSSTTLATQMSPVKRIPTPELTTEIGTNDFACDFTKPLDDAGPVKPKAHFDMEVEDSNPSIEQESPVKDRIQQFEQLDHGSLVANPTSYAKAKSYDGSLHTSFKGKENHVKQMKTRTSWRPFKQRSVQLWRRISSSFTRPVDGGNDHMDNREQVSPKPASSDSDIDGARLQPVRRRLRYRHSSLFGYHYRSSEVVRSSSNSSHSASSVHINDELVARLQNRSPYLSYRRSSSGQLPMRRTFPSLARISDSLGYSDEFDDFGLDGAALAKVAKHRDKSPAEQVSQALDAQPSLGTSQGGPSTLSRVVSRQTMAERKRRRLEEKQLRQEQREKKREEKTKAKGKEKVTGNEHDGTNEQSAERVVDKGKGKEVEGKKKESSWSKKTASGFVVRQTNDVKLRHPKPRRPGQVKKIVNMYKEKTSSGIRLGRGSGVSSTRGAVAGPSATAGPAGN